MVRESRLSVSREEMRSRIEGGHWEEVKGAEEGRSCSLATLRCEGAFLLVY